MYLGRRDRWLAVQELCGAALTAEITTAAAAAGVTLPDGKGAMAEVMRLKQATAFPNACWLGSEGAVEHAGSASVTQDQEGCLLLTDQDGDLDTLNDRLDVYEAAFVGLLPARYEGMYIDCVRTEDTPPGIRDSEWVRGVGIYLRFQRTEDR